MICYFSEFKVDLQHDINPVLGLFTDNITRVMENKDYCPQGAKRFTSMTER